jgi:hypothetical protein
MAETELVEKSEVTISASTCKHRFGFLSKRAKGVVIPEECFTCEKMLDCMAAKPEGTPAVTESMETTLEENAAPKLELEAVEEVEESTEAVEREPENEPVVVVEEIEETAIEHKPKVAIDNVSKLIKEQVAKKFGQILKHRIPKLDVQVETTDSTEKMDWESSEDDFCVESPGALYNQWSGTVIVNKETLKSLGRKGKEVELETEEGKKTVCRAYGVLELPPRAIQVPSKIKAALHVEDGAHVKVRPVEK